MARTRLRLLVTGLVAGLATLAAPAIAQTNELQSSFDNAFGTEARQPQSFEAIYASSFGQRIAELADPSQGRIGVAAVDLATGEQIMVLGDQLFPMASTSKVAVAATFLEMVEQGRYTLTSEFPLMMPVASAKFSSTKAPVRAGLDADGDTTPEPVPDGNHSDEPGGEAVFEAVPEWVLNRCELDTAAQEILNYDY
jgi:beta-lactamase class A